MHARTWSMLTSLASGLASIGPILVRTGDTDSPTCPGCSGGSGSNSRSLVSSVPAPLVAAAAPRASPGSAGPAAAAGASPRASLRALSKHYRHLHRTRCRFRGVIFSTDTRSPLRHTLRRAVSSTVCPLHRIVHLPCLSRVRHRMEDPIPLTSPGTPRGISACGLCRADGIRAQNCRTMLLRTSAVLPRPTV